MRMQCTYAYRPALRIEGKVCPIKRLFFRDTPSLQKSLLENWHEGKLSSFSASLT